MSSTSTGSPAILTTLKCRVKGIAATLGVLRVCLHPANGSRNPIPDELSLSPQSLQSLDLDLSADVAKVLKTTAFRFDVGTIQHMLTMWMDTDDFLSPEHIAVLILSLTMTKQWARDQCSKFDIPEAGDILIGLIEQLLVALLPVIKRDFNTRLFWQLLGHITTITVTEAGVQGMEQN